MTLFEFRQALAGALANASAGSGCVLDEDHITLGYWPFTDDQDFFDYIKVHGPWLTIRGGSQRDMNFDGDGWDATGIVKGVLHFAFDGSPNDLGCYEDLLNEMVSICKDNRWKMTFEEPRLDTTGGLSVVGHYVIEFESRLCG